MSLGTSTVEVESHHWTFIPAGSQAQATWLRGLGIALIPVRSCLTSPIQAALMSGQERGLCTANPCSSVSPELNRDPPTPEMENLVAGLKGGLTLTTPMPSFPFWILRKLGLRWPLGIWERESHFLRRAQAVSAQGGRCAERLLLGRQWKWGSQKGLGPRTG